MTTDDIAKLAEIMAENDLSELSLEEEGTKLRLERGARIVESMAPVAVAAAPVAVAPAVAASPEETAETEEAPCISSPIVGTFYTAPSPDADVFANVGDRVNADTVVCIIEAMKVMNEIKAEMSGVIKRVLVENSQPVEFGQPLFEIDLDA